MGVRALNDAHNTREDADRPITLVAVVASELYAGPHNIVAHWARRLREHGYRTVCVLPDEPGNAADLLRAAGATVRPEHFSRIRRDPRLAVQWLLHAVPDVLRLRDVFLEEDADVVVVMRSIDVAPAIAATLARRPLVWHVLDSAPPAWIRRPVGLLIRSLASEVPVMSPRIAQMHGLTGSRKVRFIGPPSDPAEFDKPGRLSGTEGSDGRLVVGIVAQLTPVKGIENVIRAAPHVLNLVPQAEFVIVGGETLGHENYAEFLRCEVARGRLESKIRLVGARSDLGDVFAGFDVLVISSKARSEGLPTVLLNAVMAHVPVVATAVGGIPDVLRDGDTGWLVPPDDVAALAEAISQSLLDRCEARKRSERAYGTIVPRYGIVRWLQDYAALFDSAASISR
jgi:glycosyltransferase involved in cell wall biosynthesis